MSRSLKAAMPRPERAYRMGAISFSGSSSSGWPSKLRLLVRQGVDEGEAWGLLRPCRNITHSMPFNTARHRYVLSVGRGKNNLKGPQRSLNDLMNTSKVQTYWLSSQKLCISTLACRNVWQIRGRGCQRSWCSAVGVRSHVGASSAKAQCIYRLRAHGPHTYNLTQSQTRLGVNPTQLIRCRLHQVKGIFPVL